MIRTKTLVLITCIQSADFVVAVWCFRTLESQWKTWMLSNSSCAALATALQARVSTLGCGSFILTYTACNLEPSVQIYWFYWVPFGLWAFWSSVARWRYLAMRVSDVLHVDRCTRTACVLHACGSQHMVTPRVSGSNVFGRIIWWCRPRVELELLVNRHLMGGLSTTYLV